MIRKIQNGHRIANSTRTFKRGVTFVMAALLTIVTFQINAQEVESARQSLPDNVEPSAHEQELFKMLHEKGYKVEPKKVGYDAELKVSEDAEPGEYIYQVTREYYEQFNFKWTDSEGKEHESNLLDRATDPQHILALLKEVYTNPLIPGFRRDMYRGDREEHDVFKIKNNVDGGNGELKLVDGKKQYENNAETYRSKCETVPYDPCNFGLFRDDKNPMTEVIKPFNGATALLVEMKDDFYSGYVEEIHKENSLAEKLFSQYQENFKVGKLPPDRAQEGLNYIHSIRVMPLQFYVDPESSENPGFLFNMNASLSKCFIVTKGVNRPYKAYTHRIQVNGANGLETLGTGPGEIWDASNPDSHAFEVDAGSVFYNMYEEFSPSNLGPISNAYTRMSTGHIFQVDHNCSSIIGQEHDIIFGSPENDDQIYNVNLMFFLPDRRFDGVTNKQDNDNRIYSCYTFYPKEHRPYFFFNRIYADIDQKIKVASNETVATANGKEVTLNDHALVPVHWESLYKTIIQQNEEEAFEVYRVSQGGMVRTLVPWDQIVIRRFDDENEPQTYVNAECREGELRRKIGSHVIVYVIEDNATERSGEQVRYIIQGKRAGSNFEAVESNIVIDYLPNQTNGLTLHHTQSGSLYHQRVNYYSNEVQLIHSGYYEGQDLDTEVSGNLKYNDIMIGEFKIADSPNGQDVLPEFVNATIELLRYTIDEDKPEPEPEPVRVMWCNLNDKNNAKTYINKWTGDYALVVDLTFTVDEKTQKFAPGRDYADEPLIKTVSTMAENTLQLAFNRSIYDDVNKGVTASFRPLGEHKETLGRFVDNFKQSIEGNIPNDYYYMLRIVPNTTPLTTRANASEKLMESNKVSVQVPTRQYRVGYEGYTKEQIDADNENPYADRLPENRPGFAFKVSNNPYVAEYEFRCTTHHNPLAKVQRYPGGVYRPFLYEVDNNIRELDRTADNFTGELSILLDHWVDPGDELTLVLHFRDSEENPYTNGNSYGFPIMVMPKAPQVKDAYFAAAYWTENNEEDDFAEKTFVCGTRHDTQDLVENPDISFAGYSFWVKAEGSWGEKMEDYQNVFHETSMNPNAHDYMHYYNFDFSTKPLTKYREEKVTIESVSRMYSEILDPDHVIAPYSPEGYVNPLKTKGQRAPEKGTGYYLVTDAPKRYAEVNGSNLMTGVDGIESENVEAEYYNLQGMKISKDNLTPGIYIRKKGDKTEKVMIR